MEKSNKMSERITLSDGSVVEIHSEGGVFHREDGPAWRMEDPGGRVVEMHFIHGKLSRLDGPAISVAHPNGDGFEGYYRDGVHVDPPSSGLLAPRPKPRFQPPKNG